MSYLMSSVIKFTDHVVRTLYSRDKKITTWKMYNESDSRTRGSTASMSRSPPPSLLGPALPVPASLSVPCPPVQWRIQVGVGWRSGGLIPPATSRIVTQFYCLCTILFLSNFSFHKIFKIPLKCRKMIAKIQSF